MRAAIPIGVAMLVIACQPAPRQQLLGHWRSDPAATFEAIERGSELTPLQRTRLEEVIGELEVHYEPGRATSSLAGWSRTWEYQVVGEGRDYVDLWHFDSNARKWLVRRVWVEDDRMWVEIDQLGIREYYLRASD